MERVIWRPGDDGTYECRERVHHVECPECGEDVELTEETESWDEEEPGKWVHGSYGPAMGDCCDRLLVVSHDGGRAYPLVKGRGE